MWFRTHALRVRYPAQERWAVDGVDVEIRPGMVTWLSGALGSGTSTLLLALAGLAPRLTGGKREGDVMADDDDSATLAPLRSGIAYLGPSPALQLSGIAETVRDEIAVGPMNLGEPREKIAAATDRAIGRLRLADLADRPPGALSSGETQRVLLAALLAARPRAWLLDEPFSALDQAATVQVQGLLRELARDGATVIVSCDDADIMLDVADRLIVMRAGRIALDGNPRELLAGNEIIATGASTTDAAVLAHDAGLAVPRPLTREQLVQIVLSTWHSGLAPRTRSAAGAHATPFSTSGSASAVRMTDVAFAYPHGPEVLHGVSLDIQAGEAVGVFGANGAGKSTLLRLAMALEHPAMGTVATLGRDTARCHPEDFAPHAGFLFQQPERQLFATSVRAECAFAPRLAGWSEPRVREAVIATLDLLGLADTADEHPYDLPLPRRRLLALATILTADPELLLLDEPTAGLDFASRERVIGVIREWTRRGRTVVAITHDAVFAHEALQRGVVVDHGRVVQDGPMRDVIDDDRMLRPAALAVALALGLAPGSDRRAEVAGILRSH
jgi:energy-coupling factor transport system ATP-binding protein